MKVRKIILVALFIPLCAAIISCGPAASINPLSDPELSEPDRRLEGAWYLVEVDEDEKDEDEKKGEIYLHFSATETPMMDLLLVIEDDGIAALFFEMFPTIIDGESYMNLREQDIDLSNDAEDKGTSVGSRYIFAKYDISGDGVLSLAYMDESDVKDAINNGELRGECSGDSATITDDSEDIVRFIRTSDHQELFENFGRYKKFNPPGK